MSELRALSLDEQEERVGALQALRLMREGWSLFEAAGQAQVPPAAIFRWAGDALVLTGTADYVAKNDDALAFLMIVVTTDGVERLLVRGSRTRELVSAHHNAIAHYLRTGDTTRLSDFARFSIGRYRLETDPARLVELWRIAQLDYLNIYVLTT